MKNVEKSIFSLVIALTILTGILFLPEARQQIIISRLNYLGEKGHAENLFSEFIIQNLETGLIISFATAIAFAIYHKSTKE